MTPINQERKIQRQGESRDFKVRLQAAVHLLILHAVVCGKP